MKLVTALIFLAPLGQGFRLGDTNRKALFVGGGIGVPPLLYPAKQFGKNATVVLGFRNKDAVILEEDFEKAGCKVIMWPPMTAALGITGWLQSAWMR